jgi:hypothetical protein
MRDEGTEIFIAAPSVVEIDAEAFAQIIMQTCDVEEEFAIKAANRIIDHLIDVHLQATRKQ